MLDKKQKVNSINSLQYEIEAQDLNGKSGAGMFTAIQLSLAKKCGSYFTGSYECTSNNVSCG
ncbi:salivaricin M family lantibiotic [Metabacillus litoralis]|uniref:salivaricin M family lantibiotic n=1 Tax=Metabacillus litoralis TaxID=152268 RepID=UPI002041EC9D|nr:salivaricin M family lantibiotic [Metabacillus litoralis]MCM3410013.1 salivaricin M family lantibiotic [Metabacillus litoralis]